MLAASLPEYIDPQRLADRAGRVQGCVAISAMPRLRGALASDAGEAEIDLQFGRDESGRRIVEGQGIARVQMICQRCLEAYEETLQADVALGIVDSEAAAERLPEQYDPLLADDRVRTLDLVEDEFILALPLVPMHPEADCAARPEDLQQGEPAQPVAQSERENPFAVLANLKNRSKD